MGGPPREHGTPLRCSDEKTWAGPAVTGQAGTSRYGTVQVAAWDRMHPKLAKIGGWARHPGKIPLIEGTLIQLRPARLPGYRELKPMWLWASATGAGEPRSPCCGRRTCGALTWSTPSGSSSRSWAGTPRCCATPPPRTAGPG